MITEFHFAKIKRFFRKKRILQFVLPIDKVMELMVLEAEISR